MTATKMHIAMIVTIAATAAASVRGADHVRR